ncbi:MAG: tetratricopeptide repeat protein [Spirochaetales bacterium]|jgi:tetratricopeptide (TPR) repeat protein
MILPKFGQLLIVIAALSLGAGTAQAQKQSGMSAQIDSGALAAASNSPAGRALPSGADPAFIAALYGLRDAVYQSASPDEVENAARNLAQTARAQNLGDIDENLILARIEYLTARSWNESGDKKKAIPHFEAAIRYAQLSMKSGEHPAGLMALTKALSELCVIKDLPFLMANGPKIAPNAKKILAMEPGHPGATITIAASKAYPPAIFGGNPKEAITQMIALIASHTEGFEKDDLFDIRICLGTAAYKLGRKDEARFWFGAALELYPRNEYARRELEKAKP